MPVAAMFVTRMNERRKERMRRERLGFEFGVKLNADEPGMIGQFYNFYVYAVRSLASDAESRCDQSGFEIAIELVAVTMAFGNLKLAVRAMRERTRFELAWPCA